MFDIVVVAFVAALAFLGLLKGFVKQVIGLVGVVAGYMVAIRFSGPLADKYLAGFLPVTRHVIGFLAVFLACVIAASITGWIAGRKKRGAGLRVVNRIGGGLLGGAKGYFVVAVAAVFMIAFLPRSSRVFQGSRTMKYIQPAAGVISTFAPRSIKAKYDDRAARMGRGAGRKSK